MSKRRLGDATGTSEQGSNKHKQKYINVSQKFLRFFSLSSNVTVFHLLFTETLQQKIMESSYGTFWSIPFFGYENKKVRWIVSVATKLLKKL